MKTFNANIFVACDFPDINETMKLQWSISLKFVCDRRQLHILSISIYSHERVLGGCKCKRFYVPFVTAGTFTSCTKNRMRNARKIYTHRGSSGPCLKLFVAFSLVYTIATLRRVISVLRREFVSTEPTSRTFNIFRGTFIQLSHKIWFYDNLNKKCLCLTIQIRQRELIINRTVQKMLF